MSATDNRSPVFHVWLRRRILRAFVAAIVVCEAFYSGRIDAADQTVTVDLKSGRSFTARVDRRSDETRLWLRFGDETATLLRPIQWQRVQRVIHNDQVFTGPKFKLEMEKLFSDVDSTADRNTSSVEDSQRVTTSSSIVERTVVRSLQIEAFVANWDADIESDGILLHVHPINDKGQVVSIEGTINVTLTTLSGVRRASPSNRAQSTPRNLKTLGRWNKRLSQGQSTSSGIVFKLPFQATHPEFDTTVANLGSVHVRLTVPGSGTFEATESPVRLRSVDPVREVHDMHHASRFFSHETTGRGK